MELLIPARGAQRWRRWWPCLLCGLLCCAAGCADQGPQLVPVTGRVLWKGEPLTAGSIHFHPDSANDFQQDTPSSLLQTDGSFAVRTFPYGDGIPPGRYKVTLAPQLAARIELPEYADVAKTPWTLDVPEAGVLDHVFEVQ